MIIPPIVQPTATPATWPLESEVLASPEASAVIAPRDGLKVGKADSEGAAVGVGAKVGDVGKPVVGFGVGS